MTKIRKATHIGTLQIGELSIPCAVLEEGTRVLSQRGMDSALGRGRGGSEYRRKKVQTGGGRLPGFLAATSLKPFISNELAAAATNSIRYRLPRGGPPGYGIEAKYLPQICDVWLKARDAEALTPAQQPIAAKADILVRGLAHVGIVALVDEATGYDIIRDRLALQAILDKYLRKELAAWAKRFPDEFYREMFRLKKWQWRGMSINRPSIVGRYTNNIVYERLAPGILQELQTRNPKDERGHRRAKHHQWFTEDVGHPALAQHLYAVIGLMRASATWDHFNRLLQRAFPRKGDTLELPLED